MYKIVIFPNENSVEGVPNSWVKEVGKATFCFWPKKTEKVTHYVKKKEIPRDDWTMVPCIVKDIAETFEEMRKKVKSAENITTAVESSDSDTPQTIEKKRRKRLFSTEDEEEDPDLPPPPQKKQCTLSRKYTIF